MTRPGWPHSYASGPAKMQQVPVRTEEVAKIREAFLDQLPRLVGADFSAMEARIMAQIQPPATADYIHDLSEYGDLMTVEKFRESVKYCALIDYDGYGNPVRDGKMSRICVYPSMQHMIPLDATHIMWYNR